MRSLLHHLPRLILQFALLALAFTGGVYFDRLINVAQAAPEAVATPAPDFSVFTRVWNLVYEQYVDRAAIDPKKMMYGAISGMLDTLGDSGHTRFENPDEVKRQAADDSGKFEGIGATIGTRDGQTIISAPLPGSPAERAGIRAGDVMLQVDGADVSSLTVDQIISRVRGPKGTSVRLTVLHPGDSGPVDITIVREEINLPRTSWSFVPGTHIAHIRLYEFSTNVSREVIQAIEQARAQNATGLIIDVRDNPGGLLSEVTRVTSQFLKSGNVLLEQDAQGKRSPVTVRGTGVATDLPAVVLINYGSASASEIFAGALQDYKRASIVGTRTFGTGTVLSTFNMPDGSHLVLGTSQWLTPNGHFIKGNGIAPDFNVRMPGGALTLMPEQESKMSQADFRGFNDTQLLFAVDLLQSPVTNMNRLGAREY
jgi:carboxyl-terminal processing protease